MGGSMPPTQPTECCRGDRRSPEHAEYLGDTVEEISRGEGGHRQARGGARHRAENLGPRLKQGSPPGHGDRHPAVGGTAPSFMAAEAHLTIRG